MSPWTTSAGSKSMSIFLVAVIAAAIAGLVGAVAGLAFGQRTVPDLRANNDDTKELLWHRVGAIIATAAAMVVLGSIALWATACTVNHLSHPALTTCTDHVLPPQALFKAVESQANADENSVSDTYTTCVRTQH